MHALDITGPVTLIDGRNMTLTAHVFVKVRVVVRSITYQPSVLQLLLEEDKPLTLRARAFFSDPLEPFLLHLTAEYVRTIQQPTKQACTPRHRPFPTTSTLGG